MKKYIFIIGMTLMPFLLKASTYYISPTGNDNNDGISITTPWKTLNKINGVVFSAGDKILFKAGGVWYGTIKVNGSGNSANQIIWGRYSTGNNPLISGFDTLTNWQNNNNGTWSVTDFDLGTSVNMVTVNNQEQPIGRYPKTGYLTYKSHNAKISITDPNLAKIPSFIGGELVIRKRDWILDRHLITAQNDTSVTYTPLNGAQNYVPTNGFGYFFQNHIRCLKTVGDWCYNSSTHTLTMFFGTKDPSSVVIKASRFASLLYMSSAKQFITVDGIDFEGANNYAIQTEDKCNNITIANCTVLNTGRDALHFLGSNYVTVKNCTIKNSNNNGIYLNSCNNASVIDNSIKDTHTIAGMGFSGDENGCGIVTIDNRIVGSNLSGNDIINTGYIPIKMAGSKFTIKNNFVGNYCLNKTDGGGIYLVGGGLLSGISIYNNLVLNGIGSSTGTNSNDIPVEGIYLDNDANGVELYNNTVANVSKHSYFVHRGFNINIHNNYSYNAPFGFGVLIDQKQYHQTDNIVFTNNFIYSEANQLLIDFTSRGSIDFGKIGIIDKNVYLRDVNENFEISVSNGGKNRKLNLRDWRSTFSKFDSLSTTPGKEQLSLSNVRFVYSTRDTTVSYVANGTYKQPLGKIIFKNGELMKVPINRGAILIKTN